MGAGTPSLVDSEKIGCVAVSTTLVRLMSKDVPEQVPDATVLDGDTRSPTGDQPKVISKAAYEKELPGSRPSWSACRSGSSTRACG